MAKSVLAIFILFSTFIYSQEDDDSITSFSFFGFIPNTVDPSFYEELQNSTDRASRLKLINQIGEIHLLAANTDSITHYGNLLKEEALKEETPDQGIYLSKANNLIGWGKLKNELYDAAMKYFLEGISISPEETMRTMHYKHQLGLGIVYLRKNQYETALPVFESCIKKTDDKETIILAKKFLGDIYFNKKSTEKASYYYLEVLKNIPKDTPNKIRMEVQINLGRIELFHDNPQKALDYFIPVKEEAKENHFYDLYIDAVYHIGRVYYQQEQYETAEMVISTAYTNAVQWNRLELQQKAISILKSLYVSQGNYKNAYGLMTQYVRVSNEILTKQNKKVVKELEIKYQTLQKEKEILALKEEQLVKESEIKRQRTIKQAFLIGFIVVLVPIIGLLIMYFQKLKTQIELNKSQEEVNTQKVYGLMKEQELNLIKATMEGQDKERQRLARELHDGIGGNLASIKLQLSNTSNISEKQHNIIMQLDETYNQVRDFSHNLTPKKFQKNPMTALVKEYINNVSNGSDQQISFHPYPEEEIDKIETSLKEELFKIIQELLTNCLKHAKAKNIDIYLNHYNDQIQLLFEDDGVGFDTSKMSEGIGFKNIRNRLNPLSGEIFVDSTIMRGTVVTIEIPVKTDIDK